MTDIGNGILTNLPLKNSNVKSYQSTSSLKIGHIRIPDMIFHKTTEKQKETESFGENESKRRTG